jgi:hypothetical protein
LTHGLAAEWGAFVGQLALGGGRQWLRFRQDVPTELLVHRERLRAIDIAPIVDRPRRARRDAGAAAIASIEVDHVVTRVVRNRVDGASCFAGIAANADLGIDEMLSSEFVGGLCTHCN